MIGCVRTSKLRVMSILVPCVAVTVAACAAPPHENISMTASAVAPGLGTTQSFAVLAGSTVTNTGPTVVTSNLGVSPGLSVTGFPPGEVNGGTIHASDAVAAQAQNDLTTAYNALAGQACSTNLTGQDLGGLTLTPGTYCFTSSAQLTGTLTLDAQGDPAAVFVLQIGSTLTTASHSSVRMINGGNGCNVYWQVGSSATVGTGTIIAGSIMALTSITLTTGASVQGRALARNGAVTMDTNAVSASTCQSSSSGGGSDAGSDASLDSAAIADAGGGSVVDAGSHVDAGDLSDAGAAGGDAGDVNSGDASDAGGEVVDAAPSSDAGTGTTCVCFSGGFCCGWM
jgi:hypothetical protein